QEGILPQQGEPEATRQLIANIARIELELAADGRTADSGARSLFRSLGHGRIAYLPAARAELQAYFAERGSLREAADGVLEGRIADGPAIRYEPRADLTAESLEPSPPGPAPELPAEARELIDQLAQREPRVAGRLRDSEQMRRIFAESPEAALRMLRLWRTAQQVPGADTHLHRTGMVWIADGLLLNIIAPPDIARGRRPSRGARAECARAAIHFLETLEAELPDGQFRRRLVRKRAALTQGITELRQRLGDQIVEDPAALEAFGRLQAELRAALTLQPADAPGVVQLEEFFTLFQLAGRRRYQLLVEPGPTGPQSNAATLAGLQEAGYVEVRSGRLEPGEGQPPVILTAPPGRAIGEHPAASNPRVVGFDWGGQERPGPSWEPVAEQAARLAQSNFWSLHAYVQDHHLGPLVRAELAEVRPFNDGALAEEARTDPFGLGERLCEQALRAPDEHQPIRELNQLQLALREALRRASANARRTLAERSPADPAPSERTRLIAERPLPADLQDVTVHVGEQVRSPEVRITDLFEHLESVIELGVTRIGHATILGFELPRQMPELGFSRLESEAVWVRQSNVGRAHLEVYSDYQVARMEARRLHLLSLIVRRGIWIEISPTSNAVLSGLDRLRHPVAGMLRAQPQLRITANTDDPGLLGTSLPQELSWLGTSIGASQAQLVRLILAGYDSRLGARPIDNAPQLRARISTALIRDIPPAERLQVLRQLRQRYPGGPAEPDAPISPEAFGQALGWYLDLVLY
ncbi:MAG: hypothetical protein OEY14_05590, partial [Myxococcales bacterium]|nr:hypothetical protein [Myxococcales bacterium]